MELLSQGSLAYQALSKYACIKIVQMTHPDVYLKAAQAEILIVHMTG